MYRGSFLTGVRFACRWGLGAGRRSGTNTLAAMNRQHHTGWRYMLVGGSRPLVQWNARNKGKPPMATVLNEIKRWKSDVPRPQTPRERFLAAGKNKLDRLKLRAKWILLRQNRPFNVDEISAFLSWIVMGNFLWIFIGTTTFCGLIIYAGNLFTDGKINKKVLEKLITLDNKLQVDITGNDFKASWEDGMIKFQNLVMNSGANGHLKYSFKIDTVTVTLSLSKWMEGKGLIKDVNLTGVIGTADLDEHYEEVMDEAFSPQYEFEQFEVNNLKLVMKRKKSAPMEVEIFNCKLPKLRRNWITYDFINADALSGSINGSLITLHKRQHQFAQFAGMDTTEDNSPWKKVTRLRIDQLDLSRVTGPKSKLNWLRAGTVELVVDIMLPTEDDNESLTDLLLPGHQGVEGNKYVVLDCKINFHDLQARMPAKTPSSSLTQTPYISETDLRGLVSFINNKRFGLALRASEGWDIDETATYDRAELAADADLRDNDESQVPTVKFRLVHNLADFELVDIVAILGLHSDTVHDLGPLQQLSYQNSNKLLDSAMTELLGCLMLYKEELQQRLIGAYAKRTKFEIFFNNFVLGNLLLVGLGSFVI